MALHEIMSAGREALGEAQLLLALDPSMCDGRQRGLSVVGSACALVVNARRGEASTLVRVVSDDPVTRQAFTTALSCLPEAWSTHLGERLTPRPLPPLAPDARLRSALTTVGAVVGLTLDGLEDAEESLDEHLHAAGARPLLNPLGGGMAQLIVDGVIDECSIFAFGCALTL